MNGLAPPPPRLRGSTVRVFVVAAVALVMAGCAAMSSPTIAEQESLEEVQAFTDVTARTYELGPIKVAVSDAPGAWVGIRLLQVSPALLTAPLPVRDVLVARLLGFFVVKPPEARTPAQEEQINLKAYPATNVVAVDILSRVKGLPEAVAAESVYAFLSAQAQSVAEKRLVPSPRVPHPCEQIRAFVGRFPQRALEHTTWCP